MWYNKIDTTTSMLISSENNAHPRVLQRSGKREERLKKRLGKRGNTQAAENLTKGTNFLSASL